MTERYCTASIHEFSANCSSLIFIAVDSPIRTCKTFFSTLSETKKVDLLVCKRRIFTPFEILSHMAMREFHSCQIGRKQQFSGPSHKIRSCLPVELAYKHIFCVS